MKNMSKTIRTGEFEHRTSNIERPTSNGEKKNEGKKKAEIRLLTEFDLLLEEVERLLTEELIAVHLLRKSHRPCDPAAILNIPVRLLREKKNRSIREDAILAYAEKRLKELNGL
jgi:hypothetical protein